MKRWLVIAIFLLSFSDNCLAQVLTTSGNDFWLAFIPNHRRGELSLNISSSEHTTGIVESADGSWSQSFSVTPGIVTQVAVPSRFQLDTVSRVISNKAIHVISQSNISLYASNYLQASYDNTNVLPTNTLRNRYLLQTVDTNEKHNCFCIVGIEDSTLVYFNLSDYDKDSVLLPGVNNTVLLNRGQTYIVLSRGDLSGTIVSTASCKSVAVFTGNLCAYVPSQCAACDHLVEQSIPTDYWGRKFGVTTSKQRYSDMLKVTALRDSTIVTYDDRTFMLQAGQSCMLNLLRPLDDAGFYLEGSGPLSVFLYLKGSSCAGTQGDPSCTVIHPIEQQISSITFSTFNTDRVSAHYVNIVTRSSTIDNIYIDGFWIDTANFHELSGNPDYSYARVQVSHGSHQLQSYSGGFMAHVYGLGYLESYSYAVGSTLDPINPQSYLNATLFELYDTTNNVFCLGDTFVFKSEVVDADNTLVEWDFGDGDSAIGLSFTHLYQQPGDYTVTVHYTYFSDCYDTTHYSHTLPIHVLGQPLHIADTIVCGNYCLWNDTILASPGTYSKTFITVDVCDSIDRLNLLELHLPPHFTASYEYDCEENICSIHVDGSGDYLRWFSTPSNLELIGHDGDTLIHVTTSIARTYTILMAYSNDTLCSVDTSFIIPQIDPFKAIISATPAVANIDNTTITLTDVSHNALSRVWYANGNEIGRLQNQEYNYPFDHDSVVITLASTSLYNCHDTVQKTLRLLLDGIYVPNVITPSRHDNNYFQVLGNSLMDGEIWIFDRRGALLWYSNDLNTPWDATVQGSPLPQGTYVYKLRYRHTFDPDIWLSKSGTVTVLR